MKFLVLAATLSLSVAQGFYGLVGHPNGAVTPIDEPAVAAARADHLATKFGAVAAPIAAAAPIAQVGYAAAPLAVASPAYPYAAGYGYNGPLNLNTHLVAHPNGAVVPADEPAVAAARADHLTAQGAAYAAAAPIAPVAAAVAPLAVAAPVAAVYGYNGPLNLNTELVAHPNGAVVPLDEPAVAAHRAEHLAAQGASYAAAAPLAVAAGYGYNGPLNLNTHLVAHPNGAVVPADEPAVAARRAEHLAARGASYAAAGPIAPVAVAAPLAVAAPVAAGYGPAIAAPIPAGGVYAHAAPAVYGAGYGLAPYGGLVGHPNGAVVPVDEPAVQAARADHLAAKGAIY